MIREQHCVGMDVSTCLKLKQMHRCSFEPVPPEICLETCGWSGASRNRRTLISCSVLSLLILLVLFLPL